MAQGRERSGGMTVVYLSNADPATSGGGYRRMFEEAKQLADRGHEVIVLASRTDSRFPKWRTADSVRIRSVKCLPDRLQAFPRLYYYLTRALFPFASVPILVWTLLTADVDVVIDNLSPHPSSAPFVSPFFSTPVIGLVHEYHDITALRKYNVPIGTIQLLAQYVLRTDLFAALVVPHQVTKTDLREYGVTIPIFVVPNGIHLDEYERPETGGGDSSPDVFTVSRLVRKKGLDRAIDAMPKLLEERPDVTFAIAGVGPDRQRLEERVAERGVEDSVQFLGYVPEDRKVELLHQTTLFTLPSRQEGFGIVVLEAMATGTPVVVHDLPVLRTLVPDDGNALVDTGDPVRYAEVLARLLEEHEGEGEPVHQNRERAKEYNWERIGSRLEDIYTSYTKKETPPKNTAKP